MELLENILRDEESDKIKYLHSHKLLFNMRRDDSLGLVKSSQFPNLNEKNNIIEQLVFSKNK